MRSTDEDIVDYKTTVQHTQQRGWKKQNCDVIFEAKRMKTNHFGWVFFYLRRFSWCLNTVKCMKWKSESTDLRLLDLLHCDQAPRRVAGERLLAVTDELEAGVEGDHLLAVPGKCTPVCLSASEREGDRWKKNQGGHFSRHKQTNSTGKSWSTYTVPFTGSNSHPEQTLNSPSHTFMLTHK